MFINLWNEDLLKLMRKVATFALTVTLAGVLAPLARPSAPANAALGDCRSGWFCTWEHINFNGVILVPSIFGSSYANFGSRHFDNVPSSARNNTGSTWCLYEHPNYQGRRLVFPPNTQIHDMRSYGWNDIASSARAC